MLAGCASLRHGDISPPDIEVSIANTDAAAGTATVVVVNRSRERVLIRTNDLVWQAEAVPRRVGRPNHDHGDGIIALTHDARLEPGASLDYMALREVGGMRRAFPAVHACRDNRGWTCEKYWLIPARRRWDELIRERRHDAVPTREDGR